MRLHYGGKYSGNPDDLPHLEHEPGAVPFKEVGDAKKLGVLTTILSVVLFIAAAILCWIRAGDIFFERIAVVPYLLTIIPHELLHALCYKEDVYLYHDLSHGMLFVIGPERMSKGRFIFKCLFPSIVFAFIPYIIFMINPQHRILGTFAILGIATGAGDYYNVYNALRQVPNGAKIYLHKFGTYWFMPQK